MGSWLYEMGKLGTPYAAGAAFGNLPGAVVGFMAGVGVQALIGVQVHTVECK